MTVRQIMLFHTSSIKKSEQYDTNTQKTAKF